MNFEKLSIDVWNKLTVSSTENEGYKGLWLSTDDEKESIIHIFKDVFNFFHFAIEVNDNIKPKDIIDPQVNGLTISLNHYYLGTGVKKKFIDIRCNISNYLPQFTKVSKEVCYEIYSNNKTPLVAINEVVKNWIVFWDYLDCGLLSEEKQLGLLCELFVLKKIIKDNPALAIAGWVGPYKERHDFLFDKISIEVKGTRSGSRTHTINGIDQLLKFPGKELLFISFMVSRSYKDDGVSLPNAIKEIYHLLNSHPALVVRFNELLNKCGYSPLNSDEYEAFRFHIMDSQCFWVNDNFPFLSRQTLSSPHMGRISSVRYDITLQGMSGSNLEEMEFSNMIDG